MRVILSRRRGAAPIPVLLGLALAAFTTGCSDGVDDLREWKAQQEQRPASGPQSAASAAILTPTSTYTASVLADPFDPGRLQPGAESGPNLVPSDPRLTLPALQRNPVEAMLMVGTLERAGQRLALVRVEDGLFTVSVGSVLGLHGGRVQSITDTEVRIAEPVRDGLGRQSTRTSVLTLKEARS